MNHRHLLFILAIAIASCSVKPQPIEYGSDACHYCSMTIVDRQHATQIVTNKGKAFKFDAIECMVNHLQEVDKGTIDLFLTNGYTQPGELIDATKATYLISQGIPSPMGEFLTAFKNAEDAEKALEEHGGQLYSWKELLTHFNR